MSDEPLDVVVEGIVVAGHGVASGANHDARWPKGTIALQIPRFRELGLHLDWCHHGTINVVTAPHELTLTNPRHLFRQVRWTEHHAPEDFSLTPCRCIFNDVAHRGMVYVPHAETKQRHRQPKYLVEVLAEFIPGIEYGSHLALRCARDEVTVT